MNRADTLRNRKPELIVDLQLYATDKGGRKHPIMLGWGCPCTVQQEEGQGWVGYSGWPLLGDAAMAPGELRRVGYVFLVGEEAVNYLNKAAKFYLIEGRVIGEATIVEPQISN